VSVLDYSSTNVASTLKLVVSDRRLRALAARLTRTTTLGEISSRALLRAHGEVVLTSTSPDPRLSGV
jgi:hypothetical protein